MKFISADCSPLALKKVGSPSWSVWRLCFFTRSLRIWSLSLGGCLDNEELKSQQMKSAWVSLYLSSRSSISKMTSQ
ncbi:hypothetical protein DPMN_100141 [Dreissena polymorpha]|uniref:Uncharacterized protein n=1 Tax=Dreissena polymorpha TaxID=45954 RepID=A0A9D4LHN5_DREPO|nr:hypothetical protein DPMN_100141 [Dreissena polymorpha]